MGTNEGIGGLVRMQKGEITEHLIYSNLARSVKNPQNSKILQHIADDELKHYGILKGITKQDFTPNGLKVWWYTFLGRTLGLEFALKMMENGEGNAQDSYSELAKEFPAARTIIPDEETHESKLIDLIKEERLYYASAIVLGLNDALVELTGALAGLTLALQDAKLIALSGFIIGIAAALSMSASSYLSAREAVEDKTKTPLKSATYTGIAYLLTVLVLITPYFIFANVHVSLAAMMALALIIIAAYTFYISTAKSQRFLPRFAEMAAISLGVAAISYGIAYAARVILGLNV